MAYAQQVTAPRVKRTFGTQNIYMTDYSILVYPTFTSYIAIHWQKLISDC